MFLPKNKLVIEAKKAIRWEKRHLDGTSFIKVATLPDGRDLCLVFGQRSDYDKGEDYQENVEGTIYTLCCKLAVNIDDLQCDYEMDWYMPSDKRTGEIWDTENPVSDNDDYDACYREAIEILKAFERGELKI